MMKCPTCAERYPVSQRLCPKDGAVLEPEKPAEDTILGTILDGKYRLDSFLSRGGMGAVFRGTHVMLGRPVAVKMINQDLVTSPEIVRRFQREARAATQFKHPNVVDVYDLGQTANGTLYIVMELVSGASLKESIRTRGPVEPQRIVRILGQVCDGLAQAHRRNIIHRDLKPQNIMLTVDASGTETAKIVDFGIAKTFEADANTQLTATGSTLGTPHYMSPEQATGSAVDGRSDIYSLGVILYEMLTGEVPFNDPSLPSVLIKHMSEPPQPPSLRRPDLNLPPALEAVAMRCLAKSPSDRFENVETMAGALRRALPGRAEDEATLPLRANPSASDEATIPLGAAATVMSPKATTTPGAPAAMPPPIPPPLPTATVHAARGATSPTAPGTHPTVPATAPPPAAGAPQMRRGGSPALALVIVFAALALAAGGAYYMFGMRGANTDTVADQQPVSPPPQTSPASGAEAPASSSTGSTTPPKPSEKIESAPSSAGRSGFDATIAERRAAERPADPVAGTPPKGAPATRTPEPARQVPAPAPATPAVAALAENPSVAFRCTGANEICSALRSAIQETTSRQGLSLVRSGADIELGARVELLEERVDRQFGQTMAVRSYSIEIEGAAPKLNEDVPMAPAQNVTADARFGGERFAEAGRVAAAAAIERVQQYWAKKRQ
jgi:serine/threonine protein kinase